MTRPPQDWLVAEGTVIQGHGVASGTGEDTRYPKGTLEMQQPHFLQRGLDLGVYHPGTLNLDLTPKTFQLLHPEFQFRQVEWTHLHPPENFSFSRLYVEYAGAFRPGLIYFPDPATKAAHFQPPSAMEVLTETLPELHYGDRLRVWLNPQEVILQENP